MTLLRRKPTHSERMAAIDKAHQRRLTQIDERYRLKAKAMVDAYRAKWDAQLAEMEERNRRHLSNQRRIADDVWEFRSDSPQIASQVSHAMWGVHRIDPPVPVEAGRWYRAVFDHEKRTATLTLVG